MEPQEYLRVIRRRWRLLAACILISAVAAWITTPADPQDTSTTYRATHQLIRDSTAATPPAVATLSLIVKTGEVPRRVAERIGYTGEPALLASEVTLEPDDQVGTLAITVAGSSPEEAADRANAFAEETLALLGEQSQASQQEQIQRVNEELTTLQVAIDALDAKLRAAEAAGRTDAVSEAQRDSKLRQYGAALDQQQTILNLPPPSAGYVTLQEALPELAVADGAGFSAPRSRPARTALAVGLGLVLGLAAVLLAERLDTRLHTAEATEAGFHLPVISEVPRTLGSDDVILSVTDPMSSIAEAYRTLRASVALMPTTSLGRGDGDDAGSPQVVLVTSPAPGDGKTTTVANLAACFAEAGRSVLVLACDFRRPEVHKYFNLDTRPGIADILVDGHRDLATVVRRTSVPGVSLAASGSTLHSLGDVANAGRALVARARQLADIVIIDTPPILATNDATELIPAVDAVVIVARVGRTSLDSARRTRRLLERLSAPAAGVVLVGATGTETSYSSYYTSTAPEPVRRRWPLPRRRSSEAIADRIEPWRVAPESVRGSGTAAHAADRNRTGAPEHSGRRTPTSGAPVGAGDARSEPDRP